MLKERAGNYNLIVNADKTKRSSLSDSKKAWKSVKKLKTLLHKGEHRKKIMQLAVLRIAKVSNK